jgi:hypothetical protein
LRGLATNIICSFGVPRRNVSSAGLNPSVSSLYNVARTQTELDPIAKRNVQDGGSSLLSIGLHRAVSSRPRPERRQDQVDRTVYRLTAGSRNLETVDPRDRSERFEPDVRFGDSFPQALLRTIADSFEKPDHLKLDLLSQLPAFSECGSSSSRDDIATPIGFTPSNAPVSLVFASDLRVHGYVVGTTGSGKSSLLHTIICGLAARYSPQELEMIMLDDKQAAELTFYADLLPHISLMEINQDSMFALRILEDLVRRRKERQAESTANGVGNLAEFRKRFPERRMPRVVMIWDDAQHVFEYEDRLSDDIISLLNDLATKGRSVGLHLLIAIPDLDRIGHRLQPTLNHFRIQIAFDPPEDAEASMPAVSLNPSAPSPRVARIRGVDTKDLRGEREVRLLMYMHENEKETVRSYFLNALSAKGYPTPSPKVLQTGRLARLAEHVDAMRASLDAPDPPPTLWLGDPVHPSRTPCLTRLKGVHGWNAMLIGGQSVLPYLLGLRLALLRRSAALAGWKFHCFGGETYLEAAEAFARRHLSLPAAEVRHHDSPKTLTKFLTTSASRSRHMICIWNYENVVLRHNAESRDEIAEALRAGPENPVHVLAWSPTTVGVGRTLASELDDLSEVFACRIASDIDSATLCSLTGMTTLEAVPDTRAWLIEREQEPVLFVPYDVVGAHMGSLTSTDNATTV